MTKKQLRAELEKAQNEIESLKSDVEYLEKQRKQLVEDKRFLIKSVNKKAMEKVESLCSIEYIDKATDEVFLKLSENLVESLKAKNLINMTAEERDSVYYMFERFMQLGEEKKAVLKKRSEEAEAEIKRLTSEKETICERYLSPDYNALYKSINIPFNSPFCTHF